MRAPKSNVGQMVGRVVFTSRRTAYAALEAMPEALRKRVTEATIPISAVHVYSRWREGGTAAAVRYIEGVEERERIDYSKPL